MAVASLLVDEPVFVVSVVDVSELDETAPVLLESSSDVVDDPSVEASEFDEVPVAVVIDDSVVSADSLGSSVQADKAATDKAQENDTHRKRRE